VRLLYSRSSVDEVNVRGGSGAFYGLESATIRHMRDVFAFAAQRHTISMMSISARLPERSRGTTIAQRTVSRLRGYLNERIYSCFTFFFFSCSDLSLAPSRGSYLLARSAAGGSCPWQSA
jgi:hypothetical protein